MQYQDKWLELLLDREHISYWKFLQKQLINSWGYVTGESSLDDSTDSK